MLFLMIGSSELSAQGHETIEFHDPINVHADAHDKPEAGNHGGGAGNSHAGNKPGSKSSTTANPAKVTVTIGSSSFQVSNTAQTRLKDFIAEYRATNNYGSIVSAIASAFAMFNLLAIDSTTPIPEATLNVTQTSFDTEELVVQLSAVSIWNGAMRTQAIAHVELQMASAASRPGANQEFRMWQALRDLLANPERYKGGGIKYDRASDKIIMRAAPGERYRGIAGSPVTDIDRMALRDLTNLLITFGPSRDYVMQTDYIYYLQSLNGELKNLSVRDELLLNKALLTLGKNSRDYLDQRFLDLSITKGASYSLWKKLRGFLVKESWNPHPGLASDSYIDELGFEDDMPQQSDIVSAKPAPQNAKGPRPVPYSNAFVKAEPTSMPYGTYYFWWSGSKTN